MKSNIKPRPTNPFSLKFPASLKLIASCTISFLLLAGIPLTAFAQASALSGSDSDIAVARFNRSSYTVQNGSTLSLYDELLAFVSTELLVQSPHVDWSIQNDKGYAFTIDTKGTVSANENEGSAVVTAMLNNGVVIASVTVVATTKAAELKASGFNFAKPSYTLLTGADVALLENDQIIDLIPAPDNAVFTVAQLDALVLSLQTEIDNGTFDVKGATAAARPMVLRGANKASLVYSNVTSGTSLITDEKAPVQTLAFTTNAFPSGNNPNAARQLTRSFSVSITPVSHYTSIGSLGTLTIPVGAKSTTADLFRLTPSKGNAPLTITYGRDYADLSFQDDDFAVLTQSLLDPSEVIGITVGKNKITASIKTHTGDTVTAYIIVNVIPADLTAPIDPELIEQPQAEIDKTIVPKTGTAQLQKLF